MFSFFSRKSHSKPPPEEPAPLPHPETLQEQSEAHLLASPAQAPPPSLSPVPDVNDNNDLETTPDLHTINSLRALIQSIPAKTLQSYTLTTLKALSADPPELPIEPVAVLQFFNALVPPPQLHCVRCHNSYFEVENTDRSCTMAHDDDSAEVARVKRDGYGEYETLWGCCGKTVEGDGDMGPPDGWCFEGQHTTDVKRARYRDDSTLHDDMLKSCAKLLCHDFSPTALRKRRRGNAYDSDDSRHEDGDPEEARSISTRGDKTKVKSESGTTRRGRPARRAATPSEASVSAKPKSTRKRPPKKAKLEIGEEEANPDDAMVVDEEVPKETKPKKPRAPKSKAPQATASIADVNMEEPPVPDAVSPSVSQPASPEKKPRKPRAPKSKAVAEPVASTSTTTKGTSTAKKQHRKTSTVDGSDVVPRASSRPPSRAASRAPSVPPTPSSTSVKARMRPRSTKKKPVYTRQEEEESSGPEDDAPTSDTDYVDPSSGRRRSVPDLRKAMLAKVPTAESDLSSVTIQTGGEATLKAQPRRKKLAEIVDTSVDGEVGMKAMR